MSRKRGFTLIELLVVIAIIALLLAVVVPSLRKAKEYTKRIICTSNIRQIGIAMRVYGDGNDDEVIPLTRPDGVIADDVTVFVQPHHSVVAFNNGYRPAGGEMIPLHLGILYREGLIETPELFYCPAQPLVPNYDIPYNYNAYTDGGTAEWGTITIQASWTADYCRTSYNYWTYYEKRIEKIGGHKPIMIDNIQEWEVLPHRKGGPKDSETTPQGLSALFADGHVSFCNSEELWSHYTWNGKNSADGINGNGPGDDIIAFERILKALQGQ